MIQSLLRLQLDKVAGRYRDLRFWQLLAVVWLLAVGVAALVWSSKDRFDISTSRSIEIIAAVAALLAGLAFVLSGKLTGSYQWLARQIERAFPELRCCLLAAVEQRPELPDGKFGYLQTSVIREAIDHARTHEWREVVPKSRFVLAGLANFVTGSLFAVACAAIVFNVAPPMTSITAAPDKKDTATDSEFSVTVEPGDVEVEKGTSLLVLARVTGAMPAEAALSYQEENGTQAALAMSASLEDPVFGGRISVVERPLTYHVDLGGRTSPSYRVSVFEYPRLERADAHLAYPKYTGLEDRLIQDVRTVTVVEGTKLTLRCLLNKAVASATLVDKTQDAATEPIALAATSEEPLVYAATLECKQSRRVELQLVDDEGRKNLKPAQFTINVVPNQPVSLKPLFPARDLDVSALEELDLKSTAWDDFGVKRMGLTYSLAGHDPVDVVLAEDGAAKQKHELASQIRLEELNAAPDQLLSYHWWAEDLGPEGQTRRTFSDMYFAEVRPFEEIFRQGEHPPGGQQQGQQGQGQNAQQAQELAQLQKDIINATWKLLRREVGASLTAEYPADAEQVFLSQAAAREQAAALGDKLQDSQSKAHLDEVLEQMRQAIEHLKTGHEKPAREPLTPALAAEQAAYQGLLKLRAREHEVVRQEQGQQSGSPSASRSQQQMQQLQQLEMREEENRYEGQRLAQDRQQETAEERENRQVLNRLRELARRQHDLNERLKEFQAALQEAKEPKQKEEIRRQLQRLQEEQRRILQDTDELQARLEQPENAERMSQERQQLEETRDQVRRASESLEQEKVTQAAASATRAEQQFDELREEFRRRASDRFNEEMRQMRQAARELDERERELSKQLSEPAPSPEKGKSLRDPESKGSEKVADEFDRQRQRLTQLQEQMRDTISRAETTEPILTERLYDTARDIEDKKVEQLLQAAERSVREGLAEDARLQEQAAGEGIRQLREGIERAAEGVLGDETEALRRARAELAELSRDLNEEIRRNAPEAAPSERAEQQDADREALESLARATSKQGPSDPQESAEQDESQRRQGTASDQSKGDRKQAGQAKSGQAKSDQQRGPGQRERGDRPDGKAQGADAKDGQEQAGQEGQESKGSGKAQGKGSSKDGQRQPREGQPKAGDSKQGQQAGEGQPGEGEPGQGQPSEGQEGQPGQPGQEGEGQPGQPGDAQGKSGERQTAQGQRERRGARRLGGKTGAEENGPFNEGGPFEPGGRRVAAPLTGENFRDWSDRLRDVEEMVDDPELRADAARIRERARAIRAELKRHSAPPNWELVREQVAEPLLELADRVSEELLRRTSKNARIPLDRDPVPPQYSEKTRRYYEQLGSGK